MQDRNLNMVGGVCAILLGVITATTIITYILLPSEQRLAVPAAQILPSLAQNATPLLLDLWQLVALGVLGLAVVPAVSRLVHAGQEGWVTWASNLGLLGFAVSAVSNALSAGRLPVLASAYVAGDDSTKAAIAATWRSTLDFQGLWQFGAIGFWILVVSILVLRGNLLPPALTYIGLVLGVLNWLGPVALLLKNQTFIIAVVGPGAVLATIWYIWVGLILSRKP